MPELFLSWTRSSLERGKTIVSGDGGEDYEIGTSMPRTMVVIIMVIVLVLIDD